MDFNEKYDDFGSPIEIGRVAELIDEWYHLVSKVVISTDCTPDIIDYEGRCFMFYHQTIPIGASEPLLYRECKAEETIAMIWGKNNK
jgi:hypothetical protein